MALAQATEESPRTVAKGLELQNEWLRLIHYRHKTFGGYVSKVEGSAFFLSPEGRTSPRKELEATLGHFAQGPLADREYFQCHFLARRDFLEKSLSISKKDILPCAEFDDWIARLDPQKMSLIFASGSLHEPASSFGHVFLKIQNPKNTEGKDLLNYAINYAARTQDTSGALYAWYGLFGFFPGTYGMAPYHHLIKGYTNMEGRDLWEYELNLTPIEIRRLMKHLLELERGYFNYYFLDENCALMIAEALDVARPDLQISSFAKPWTLPLDTVRRVVQQGLVAQLNFRPSLQTQFDRSYRQLNLPDKLSLRHLIRNQDEPLARATEMSKALLETAQNYFSLKGSQDFQRYKEVNYRLSLETANRDFKAEDGRTLTAPANQPSPDQGDDASMLALGGYQENGQTLGLLKMRAVGYDLLSSPIGITPFSEYELVSLELQGQSGQQTSLRQLQLVSFLATEPVSWIASPLSFGFAVQRDRVWRLPFRLGYSFDLNWFEGIRWMFFATGRVQGPVDDSKWFQPGYQTLLAMHLNRFLRALISYDAAFTGNPYDNELRGGLALQIHRDLDMRIESGRETRALLEFYF
jgi:hypothetical protein